MISVITPTYNRAHLLPRLVNSVINQTFKDWELIIVDDGSTDNTAEFIQPFLKDTRIKYIKKDNSGAAHTRNVGVDNSKGEYITFLDSDDEAKPEWLKEIIKEVNKSNPQLICCGCDLIDNHGNLTKINLPISHTELFGMQDYLMTGGVYIVKREIFNDIGGFDNELTSGQHYELSFRLLPYILNSGGKIANLYKSLIKIHIHLGERIRGNPEMKFKGTTYCLEKHQDFFSNKPKIRSNYEGAIGRNAYLTGRKKESIRFFIKSFKSNPTPKKFGRLIIYGFKNYL